MGTIRWFGLLILSVIAAKSQTFYPDCTGETNEGFCELPLCPDCAEVDCLPRLTEEQCPSGTVFMENVVGGGCCPGCVKYLKSGDECDLAEDALLARTYPVPCTNLRALAEGYEKSSDSTLMVPVISIMSCGLNSKCEAGFCTGEEDRNTCTIAKDAYEQWIIDQETEQCSQDVLWDPHCDEHGQYGPVQAKTNYFSSDGRKFCSDPFGNRLFGDADPRDTEVTCLCSRKHWDLEQDIYVDSAQTELLVKKRGDVSLHCDKKGNFESLQCDQSRCWCVEPMTGKVVSNVLHENLVELLPCYDPDEIGFQYLRQCESRKVGKAQAKERLERHNLEWFETNEVSCHYDGSFGLKNCDNTQCRCVDENNQQIASYFAEATKRDEMDCRCARDEANGISGQQCVTGLGNYQEVQSMSLIEFCVDKDGFRKTGLVSNTLDKKCNINNCPSRIKYCEGLVNDNINNNECIDANTGACETTCT